MDKISTDAMRSTLQHTRRVGTLLMQAVTELQTRAINHDSSKFSPEEFDLFARETVNLKGLTYGSPEYKEALERLGPALQHHYAHNMHHPEHHPNGIRDMDLLDLLEMLADWKAATERHENGSLKKSILDNAVRFGYDHRMMFLLGNTARNRGWITEEDFREIEKRYLYGYEE
jgi:hypothetical protein